MRARDLKKWQLFYNTNNYLCLVYDISHGKAHIVNYNGTFYKANRDSEYKYSDEKPPESVEDFFAGFPTCKLDDWRNARELESIKAKFKLLLLQGYQQDYNKIHADIKLLIEHHFNRRLLMLC